jgi:hypothetical protein
MYNVGDHVTIKQTVWQDRNGRKVEPLKPMTVCSPGVEEDFQGRGHTIIWVQHFGGTNGKPLAYAIEIINHDYTVSGYYASTYQSYCGHITADTIEEAFILADAMGVIVCSIVQGFINDLSALSNWPKVD